MLSSVKNVNGFRGERGDVSWIYDDALPYLQRKDNKVVTFACLIHTNSGNRVFVGDDDSEFYEVDSIVIDVYDINSNVDDEYSLTVASS